MEQANTGNNMRGRKWRCLYIVMVFVQFVCMCVFFILVRGLHVPVVTLKLYRISWAVSVRGEPWLYTHTHTHTYADRKKDRQTQTYTSTTHTHTNMSTQTHTQAQTDRHTFTQTDGRTHTQYKCVFFWLQHTSLSTMVAVCVVVVVVCLRLAAVRSPGQGQNTHTHTEQIDTSLSLPTLVHSSACRAPTVGHYRGFWAQMSC